MCRWHLVPLPALALLASCAVAPEAPPVDPTDLMDADRDFSAATAEFGSEGWASFFAEDGAVVREQTGEIRGRAAILESSRALDRDDVQLSWEPYRADVAASGDLGYTVGRYRSLGPGPDGSIVEGQGVYVSIWRKQADGSWKVVMDLGNPTEPPPEG